MAQGNYDHPSYIARVHLTTLTTAGANGTSAPHSFPSALRLRTVSANVITAGTSTGAAVNMLVLTGTTTQTAATIALGTNTANTVILSTDPNFLLPAGSILYFTNGTDATSVVRLSVQNHIDPLTGTWSPP